jgi:hypothetical protein
MWSEDDIASFVCCPELPVHNLVDGRRRKQHRGNPVMRYSTRNEHPTLLSIRWLWRQYKIWIFPSFVVKICKNTFFGVSNLRCVPYKIYGGGLRSRSCISCMWRLQSRSHLGRDLYGPAERRCTDRTVTATDLSIFFPCGVDFILNGLQVRIADGPPDAAGSAELQLVCSPTEPSQ